MEMGMELQRRKKVELGMGILGSIESGTSKGSNHGESEHQRDQVIGSWNIKGIEHIKTHHQVKSSQSSLVTLTSFALSSD
jgi:hypothetical protein